MPGFLIDENLPPLIAGQLRQREPGILVYTIGGPDAPPKGTSDPDILNWIEAHNCWLITNNRASMPSHLQDHLVAGKHVPGVFIAPFPLNIGALLEELTLLWGASLPDEYQDHIIYLPLTR